MKPITDYLGDGLSVRAYNCLARAGVTDLNELSNWTCDDLRNVRNLGKKQYQEIIDICHKNGIYLKQESVSMKFVNIPKEAVLDEIAKGSRVCLIDKYNEVIDGVDEVDINTIAVAIKGDESCEETQYEFYKKVQE